MAGIRHYQGKGSKSGQQGWRRNEDQNAQTEALTLDRVCYAKTHRRFKVRGVTAINGVWVRFAIYDRQEGIYLFQRPMRKFRTAEAAQRYLETTTLENRAYKLWRLNRALDWGNAA
jgi:hypothetical protein